LRTNSTKQDTCAKYFYKFVQFTLNLINTTTL